MSKQSILTSFEELTIEQSTDISLNVTGTGNKKVVVVKTVNGSGFSGSLSDLINDFYAESFEDREWIIDKFYTANQQAMGGQPNCPC